MAYDNEMSGVLFKVREKRSEKAPDYTGKVQVDGEEYRLAGWIRTGKSGAKFLSLKVSVADEDTPRRPASDDEEVPF